MTEDKKFKREVTTGGHRSGQTLSLVQMQAKVLAEKMFTDMMASAGVDHRRMAQELLFFLPRGFCDAYEQLWYRGVAAKGTDGGSDERGRGNLAKAELGRAEGGRSGGAGKRRSHKKYWVIADEQALEIKDRVDKRLRGIAREIGYELAEIDQLRKSGGYVVKSEHQRAMSQRSCGGCGRFVEDRWDYCPYDGSRIGVNES